MGLTNKFLVHALQEQGLNTVEPNEGGGGAVDRRRQLGQSALSGNKTGQTGTRLAGPTGAGTKPRITGWEEWWSVA